METWTIKPFGIYSTEARRTFGPYTVIAVANPTGGSWRIDVGGVEIARFTAPLGAKTIEQAIAAATTQISALIDALAPFSTLAAKAVEEAAHAEEVIASTRALLEESKAAMDRQHMRIADLESENVSIAAELEATEAAASADRDDADYMYSLAVANYELERRNNDALRRVEMAVVDPEEGAQ